MLYFNHFTSILLITAFFQFFSPQSSDNQRRHIISIYFLILLHENWANRHVYKLLYRYWQGVESTVC
jgi:hypothetical protein